MRHRTSLASDTMQNGYRYELTAPYFGVDASQPLSVWRKKGWIYPNDPRG